MTTVALVAAKDAADSIGPTVHALSLLRGVDEVWVVDDGSTDATARVAAQAGARVVRLEENVGKGGALRAGADATPHADRYLLADADLGATASGLQALLEADTESLVVGVLPSAGKRGGFGSVKRFARAGIERACGVALDAPLSGQRVIDGTLFRSLTLAPRFGVEVGMTIDAVRSGARVTEVPVDVDHHHTGRSVAGFAHRARQGRDIMRALLPRVTTVRQRAVAVVALGLVSFLVLSLISWVRAVPAGQALPPVERVVVFGFDHLALDDLGRSDLPALRALARDGATGALSVRTTDRRARDRRGGSERPAALDAYATLGASARVRAVTGLGVEPGAGLREAMRDAQALAASDKAAAPPGGLGDALHRAGRRTGLVAGAQLIDGAAVAGFPAAGAIADSQGRIDEVDVSSGLLEATTGRGALRASIPGFVVATATALRDADVVFIDPGETARAMDVGTDPTQALRRTDQVLAGVRGVLPPRTMLIVVSPTPPAADWELTPVVVFGPGVQPGLIASASTRRSSLAVLTDLTPTILRAVGAKPTGDMTGAVLRRTEGQFSAERFARLESDGAVRSRFFLGAAVGYTVLAIVLYLGVLAAVVFRRVAPVRSLLRSAVCMAAAFPVVLLLTGALQHWGHGGGESPAVLIGSCVALGAVGARWRGLTPLYVFAGGCVGVIALDVAATGPIHTASLLGYSIQTTGRFYGLPNASFAVFGASVVVAALAAAGGVRPPSPVRAIAGATVLAAGTAFVAAPWLANDVGGTLALAPVAAVMAWAFFGRRFSTRVVLVGAAILVLGLVMLLGAEAILGSGTHLSRALTGGGFRSTLEHRVNANVGLLLDQWWGFLVFGLAIAGLTGAALGRAQREAPLGTPVRVGLVAGTALSLLAFIANDSGPVVSVLCVVVVVPVLALRAIELRP